MFPPIVSSTSSVTQLVSTQSITESLVDDLVLLHIDPTRLSTIATTLTTTVSRQNLTKYLSQMTDASSNNLTDTTSILRIKRCAWKVIDAEWKEKPRRVIPPLVR